MPRRIAPGVADLATQHTLELSNVLSLSEFAGVPVQALFNFPSVIIILHLQCSQVLHEYSGTEDKNNFRFYIRLVRDAK